MRAETHLPFGGTEQNGNGHREAAVAAFFFSSRRRHTRFSRDWSSDVCSSDSVEDVRNAGYFNGVDAVTLAIFKQPGANIIDTVDHIRDAFPQLEAAIPQSIRMTPFMDQTTTIRASVADVERSLLISVILVILV